MMSLVHKNAILTNQSFGHMMLSVVHSIVVCILHSEDTEIECSTGYYSAGNTSSCSKCDAGQICPNTDGTDIEDCEPGTYSLSGAVVCTDCLPG